MKTWIRHTLSTAVCALLVAGVVYVCIRIQQERTMATCQGVQVEILGKEQFLNEEEVKSFVVARYGAVIGQGVDSVRLDKMEKILDAHHFVAKSEVWLTNDGVLHMEILQKSPLLRFNHNGNGFYIDRDGVEFPLHDSWTAEVPVVNGKIQSKEWALAVVEIVSKCDIAGMNVEDNGAITLQTERGGENILFGMPDKIDEKISLINTYYDKIVPAKGNYGTVNVKYKDKIYCKYE